MYVNKHMNLGDKIHITADVEGGTNASRNAEKNETYWLLNVKINNRAWK